MVQEQATPTKQPSFPEGHPLCWPAAPKGLRAFLITLQPAEKGEKWLTRRLSGLTTKQMRWLIETVFVELARREHRKQTDGESSAT